MVVWWTYAFIMAHWILRVVMLSLLDRKDSTCAFAQWFTRLINRHILAVYYIFTPLLPYDGTEFSGFFALDQAIQNVVSWLLWDDAYLQYMPESFVGNEAIQLMNFVGMSQLLVSVTMFRVRRGDIILLRNTDR